MHPFMRLPPPHQVIAMFPFFWIDRDQVAVKMHRIAAAQFELLGWVAGFLSWLPEEARLAVVRKYAGQDTDETVDLLVRYLTPV